MSTSQPLFWNQFLSRQNFYEDPKTLREARPIQVALAGNPNSGKTSLFNRLTGARQHVGNYPGVTVERRHGSLSVGEHTLELVDLPGAYSLTPHSLEEVVVRFVLLQDPPDVVVSVVDASNLERNLYLTTELLELGLPVVVALNMIDQAERRGAVIDLDALSDSLGVPVVATVGHRGHGVDALVAAAVEVATAPRDLGSFPSMGDDLERAIAPVTEAIRRDTPALARGARWLALKLVEGDPGPESHREALGEVLATAERSRHELERSTGESAEVVVAERRYRVAADLCRTSVRTGAGGTVSRSDRVDAIVTHRIAAIPVFLGLMYLVFHLTFTLGEPLMAGIEAGFAWLGSTVTGLWPAGTDSLLRSLLVDGVIAGVGGVLVFLPNILLLFLAISFLEDSGYMARAAFIMDRLMRSIGLHGKSFIPMLIGFGCSVPAIMATRTLDHRRDRLVTMLVLPLISCGARLPIYALIIPAFFPQAWQAPVLWMLYLTGIGLAVGAAKLLRTSVFRGPALPFVMELPPYRLPTLRSTVQNMTERSWMYVRKAGTVILGISIVLWALSTFPRQPEPPATASAAVATATAGPASPAGRSGVDRLRGSAAGRIGTSLEPVLRPMGFDWRIGTALIGAVAAKEVFVAQLGIAFALSDDQDGTLRERLRTTYSPLTALCVMLFCLISAPCMATVAIVRRESGSWWWALAQWGGLTLLAWVVTTAVFQTGTFLGLGA